MRGKKPKPTEAELAHQKLERKVDVMMSVEPLPPTEPEAKPEPKPKATKTAKPAVQSISAPVPDQTTAPELPTQLLKTLDGKKPAKSTIKIITETPSDDDPP